VFWIRIAALAFALSYVFEAFPDFCGLLLRYIYFYNWKQGCIYWKIPPPPGGNISRCHLGGKNMKRPREKGGKCKRKMKKGEKKEKGNRKCKGEVTG
jgi:hypothetical protein